MTPQPPGKVAAAMQALRDENAALRALIAAIGETAVLPQPADSTTTAWWLASRNLAIVTAGWCNAVTEGGDPGRAAAAIREEHAKSAARYEHYVPAPDAAEDEPLPGCAAPGCGHPEGSHFIPDGQPIAVGGCLQGDCDCDAYRLPWHDEAEARAMSAPAELVIEVTQDDIAKGVNNECMWCPVALAARRALGWPSDPSGGLEVLGTDDGHAVMVAGGPAWMLPPEASEFIEAFDHGDAVTPSTFIARLESAS